MRSRGELRAERREAERHAQETSGQAFSFASARGPSNDLDAAQGDCGGVVSADPASASTRGDTSAAPDLLSLAPDGPPGLALLRAMPVVREVLPIHPLRVYIVSRGLGLAEAADLLGVSERSLRDVLGWRSHFPRRKAQFIAGYLHVES